MSSTRLSKNSFKQRSNIRFKQSINVSGGSIGSGDGYIYHIFTVTSTFIPNETLNAEVLIIGAGGHGGVQGAGGGGGGAGGVRLWSPLIFNASSYAVTVGTKILNANGGASSIVHSSGTLSSDGGGAGATASYTGNSGGSGGGSSQSGGYPGGAPTGVGIGYAGGAGNTDSYTWRAGGGGGGYSGPGLAGDSSAGGSGGQGLTLPSGLVTILGATHSVVASGGGGSSQTGTAGVPGTGGGAGAQGNALSATSYGSGGGGSKTGTPGYGMDGLVVVRYVL